MLRSHFDIVHERVLVKLAQPYASQNTLFSMQAVVVALEQALDSGLKYVDIYTDSIYVIKGMCGYGPALVVENREITINYHVHVSAILDDLSPSLIRSMIDYK